MPFVQPNQDLHLNNQRAQEDLALICGVGVLDWSNDGTTIDDNHQFDEEYRRFGPIPAHDEGQNHLGPGRHLFLGLAQ